MWHWALKIIDSLDYGMAKVADLMVKHVFILAIGNISVTVSVEVLEKSGSTYPVSVLSIVPSEELQERQRRRLGRTSPRSSEIRQRARTHRGSLAGEEK